MTQSDRFERDLPDALRGLYLGSTPSYRDDILSRTAANRQRPGWTFIERWLPVSALSERLATAPRVPLRVVAVAALLILALVAAAAYVGSQQRRLPAPFGRAGNGQIAYASGGDIYLADPVSGKSVAIVAGPEMDFDPVFSLDGTQVAFRRGGSPTTGGSVVVARADGSDSRIVAPGFLVDLSIVGFSPDGSRILLAYTEGARKVISVAATDGGGNHVVPLPMSATEPSFGPPDGREIVFVGATQGTYDGIFRVALDGSGLTTLVNRAGYNHGLPIYSPDGAQIAYSEWGGPDSDARLTVRARVMAADGTGDRLVDPTSTAVWDWVGAWSNDGTRIAIVRGYGPNYEDVRPAIVPVRGTGTAIEVRDAGNVNLECCSAWTWAPDDSAILGAPTNTTGTFTGHILVDPLTGASRAAPWTTTSGPTWQRVAD
jgi:WD40-like Beta Propeller Repeat